MKENKGSLLILFFTLVIVMLGFGMIIPILPFYVESFGAGGAALGMLMAIYGVTQFLFAPIWGQISDRVGRKKILLVGVFGNAIAQLLFGLSTELWMLFAARALAGLLSSATLPTAMAYISDTTTTEKRSGGMGAIGAAMGIGMVLGPGIGGWMGGASLAMPFFFAAGLSVIAMLFIVLFLPESMAVAEKSSSSERLHGPRFSVLVSSLYGPIGLLLIMAFMMSFALTNLEAVFGLYSIARYGYSPQTVGWLFALMGITAAAVQGGLVGPLTRRFGEVKVIRTALVLSGLGFVFFTLAQTTPLVIAAIVFFITCNSLLHPSTASLISKRATGGQGAAMGVTNSFTSLGRIVGPLWAGFMFDININLPYLSGAVFLWIGFLFSLFWLDRVKGKVRGAREVTREAEG